ncbi:phospholipase A2 inhibitor and Ly6/PLAUR domain-containing protein-like [Sciurus carolinensis]|uniref:phospholipase A2 inhibitor and Ly6/PLAUR domain-containing protein-like n=1 Tax=Sciurus carolinensis TaxID=30640 RepID=UPI001FB29216|nr:phospholipase A2 inhibitor and Ly6/PLAUR domain-containing protein-like [Sciurus carolinensis]
MLRLLPALALLGVLAAPEENGTVLESGSCVAPGGCQEGAYALTYSPHPSLWVSTVCCENCSSPQKGPHATVTHSKPKATICFTCSDLSHCNPVSCPEDRNYCLQTTGITALGEGNSVAWRNGSCVASKDCKLDSSISALTYSAGFGFWVNTTCCQGNCQESTPLAALPASRTLSKFLCPTCAEDHQGPCNSSFYMQCPLGETECVQLDLMPEEGGRNLSLSLRGCGSRDLCDAPAVKEGRLALPGLRLARPPYCSTRHRAVLESQCLLDTASGLRLALPALVVALGTSVLA